LQSIYKQLSTPHKRGIVQTELPKTSPAACNSARRYKLEHPPDVFRGDKMYRPAYWPGADDGPIGDCLFDICFGCPGHAKSDRPKCPEIVLRLDGAEPGYYLSRLFELGLDDALIEKTVTSDIQESHS